MEILLADDNPEVRSALRLLLEQDALPFNITEISDKQELFESLWENCPVAVLLDWELPGFQSENSLEIVNSCCPNIKVIAMSSRYEARHEALKAGADAFISKAEPPEKILATLYALLLYVNNQ
jgi:DNA-binding NarL/FixJ family response regulator